METLQDQLNNVQSKLNAERELGGQKDNDKIAALEAQEAELTIQVAQHREQELETRVQEQVQTQGYLLDTLYTSNGLSMAELSYSPANHELVAIEVQKAFLAQQDAFNGQLNTVNELLVNATAQVLQHLDEKENLEKINFTLSIEKIDAESKRDNAINQLEEQQEMNGRQRETIESLKQQLAGEAIPVAPLSAEEQETKLINELNGKRIKVINMHPKTTEFNNKLFVATNALTGIEFEDYILYSKRYEEISIEEAAQLQADYKAKKEEIAKLTEIPELEVIQDIAPIEEQPDTQDYVPSANNGGNEEIQGDGSLHEVVEQAEVAWGEPLTDAERIEQIEREQAMTHDYMLELAARVEALEQYRRVANEQRNDI